MTTIRRTRAGDIDDVAALVSGSWKRTYTPLMGEERVDTASARLHAPEQFGSEVDNPRVASFVAVDEAGLIVGHALAELGDDGEIWLERLHIDPAHFGSGLAADLLHAAIAAFTGEASTISLEVLEGNDRAIAFYRKQGFDAVEHKSACGSLEGVPALIMRRPLPRA